MQTSHVQPTSEEQTSAQQGIEADEQTTYDITVTNNQEEPNTMAINYVPTKPALSLIIQNGQLQAKEAKNKNEILIEDIDFIAEKYGYLHKEQLQLWLLEQSKKDSAFSKKLDAVKDFYGWNLKDLDKNEAFDAFRDYPSSGEEEPPGYKNRNSEDIVNHLINLAIKYPKFKEVLLLAKSYLDNECNKEVSTK